MMSFIHFFNANEPQKLEQSTNYCSIWNNSCCVLFAISCFHYCFFKIFRQQQTQKVLHATFQFSLCLPSEHFAKTWSISKFSLVSVSFRNHSSLIFLFVPHTYIHTTLHWQMCMNVSMCGEFRCVKKHLAE